jgi:hypothetical protein
MISKGFAGTRSLFNSGRSTVACGATEQITLLRKSLLGRLTTSDRVQNGPKSAFLVSDRGIRDRHGWWFNVE